MSFKIIPAGSFDKELKRLAKKYPSLKQDYGNLLDELELNHKLGTPIGRNCYKIRLSITSKGKGKSGGARVITHLIVNLENETLYLLKIYDKADQDTITESELKFLLATFKVS
jgi:mRNA-degrading endonuclease RelE of RelBE toxin-antitoxin system